MVIKNKIKFMKVLNDIKNIKIQGARNIAGYALYAYLLSPTGEAATLLKKARETEPMLVNVIDKLKKGEDHDEVLAHFFHAQEKINEYVNKIIKNGDVVFTHCHSTNVTKALIDSFKNGKKFEVYNTETRPLFQGRKTARQLSKVNINVTTFIDSAVGVALSKENNTKKVTKIFLGSDALVKDGIINKIGSEVIARLAREEKIPVYIVADSWKFSNKKIPIENRKLNEVWDKAPKNIKIKNPAFEFVPKKYIKGIITELGLMRYDTFIKRMNKNSNNL